MTHSANKVQLVGRIGNHPEIKEYGPNKKLARFSIATHEFFRNWHGETMAETTWHNLVAWGKLAEITEKSLSKGQEVCIEGKLINRSYVDKSGVTKYTSEIHVTQFLLIAQSERRSA